MFHHENIIIILLYILQKLIIGNTKGFIRGKALATEDALNDKANVDHEHSAVDITSGVLGTARLPTIPVSKGGTGRTTLTSGYFLKGNGTSTITMSSSATVKSDLGITSLETEVEDLKTSVSEGKALVAEAVTDKGVQTASDATFQQIATNIGNIQTGPSYSTVYNFSISKSYVEYEWTLPSDVFTSELYGIMITFKYNMIVVNTDMPIDDESTIESKKTEMFIPFTKIPKFESINGFDELRLDYVTKVINYSSSFGYSYAHIDLAIKFNSIDTHSASIRIDSSFSYNEPLSSGLSSIKLVKQQ